MNLRVNLKPPVVENDGKLRVGDAYSACLKIGNVSVAFDGRPDRRGGVFCLGYHEYYNDPVRINDTSVHDVSDPAEKLLLALAADLGYDVVRRG